jgi:nucleoside phosphorylase
MRVDWSVYGELNKGHALLAASGSRAAAGLLTQHTDRPGDPPVGQAWGPVESGFPFRDQYVFLRTLPDVTAGRAGMVRSYAAFVPLTQLAAIRNPLAVFASLPIGLDRTEPSPGPLEISDTDLASAPPASAQLGMVATQLGTAGALLPVVWSASESYLPTVAALWARLPVSLRATFAFFYQFTPEHRVPAAAQIVATLPGLGTRWPGPQLLPANHSVPAQLNSVQRWLSGVTDGSAFDAALIDYEITLADFQKISLLAEFAELVARLPELKFAETRRVVNILAVHAKPTGASAAKRTGLFKHLCTLVADASVDELLALRNLPEKALPDLISVLKPAIRDRVATIPEAGEPLPALVSFLELAVAAHGTWWSIPVLSWLRDDVVLMEKDDAKLAIALFASTSLAQLLSTSLGNDPKLEDRLLARMPNKMQAAHAAPLLDLAVDHTWMRLHAAVLLTFQSGEDALVQHSAKASNHIGGFKLLLAALGAETVLNAACKHDSNALTAFAGKLVSQDEGHLPAKCAGRFRLLKAAVEASDEPISAKLRTALVAALVGANTPDTELSGLCVACADHDISLFCQLENPGKLLDLLPRDTREAISLQITSFIEGELRAARPIPFAKPVAANRFISAARVIAILRSLAVSAGSGASVNAFQCLPFLSDTDCRAWLVDYFTRTQNHPISPKAAAGIGSLLFDRDFPETAKMVRETVEQFHRSDVAPIHERIHYKYQMARAYQRDLSTKVVRLPKVVIATALPLERQEVIRFLPNAEYDKDLEADVAVWPHDYPLFQIYVFVTGQGNLSAQSTTQRLLANKPRALFAFFLGVGGGLKDNEIGDVVYSTKVYYYESGKEHDEGINARPEVENTSNALVQLAIRVADKPWQPKTGGRVPRAGPAIIASGELVLTSTLPDAANFQLLKTSYNDTQVVDKESYGFLRAAAAENVRHRMVIRGVSDQVAGKAESDAKGNQPRAANNAATFLFALLRAADQLVPRKKVKKTFLGFTYSETEERSIE